MKRFALFGVAGAIALGGCTLTQKQVDDVYFATCSTVPIADAAFQLYAGTGKVKQSVIDAEKAAVAAAQAVCDGPRPTNVQTALSAVQRAISAIVAQTVAAKAQAGT